MFWLRLIYSRLYGLLRKDRIAQEMDDEMRFRQRPRMAAMINGQSSSEGEIVQNQPLTVSECGGEYRDGGK